MTVDQGRPCPVVVLCSAAVTPFCRSSQLVQWVTYVRTLIMHARLTLAWPRTHEFRDVRMTSCVSSPPPRCLPAARRSIFDQRRTNVQRHRQTDKHVLRARNRETERERDGGIRLESLLGLPLPSPLRLLLRLQSWLAVGV